MSAEEETTMHVEEPQEAEAVAEGEQKTNLRKRRPRAAKQVEPKKEEPEPIEMLSDDMKEEVDFA
jgi:hypothetical protein